MNFNFRTISFAVIASVLTVALLQACKKDDENTAYYEPISIREPDSLAVRKFPGDTLAIRIEFTTDRPITWVKGMYDIDSLHPAGYVPTFPDTLFFIRRDTVLPRSNKYTYTGSYIVPDTLSPYSVVRFNVSMRAYTLNYSKQFKINVR